MLEVREGGAGQHMAWRISLFLVAVPTAADRVLEKAYGVLRIRIGK